jgi:hypothetical protein
MISVGLKKAKWSPLTVGIVRITHHLSLLEVGSCTVTVLMVAQKQEAQRLPMKCRKTRFY